MLYLIIKKSIALVYMSQPYSKEMVMRMTVTYTPYATSSREQTGNVITFAHFEEGNILTETRNDTESGDKSDNESIMISEQDMENINYGDESDHDLISTEMLEDIHNISQTHLNVTKREERYKIRDRIRKRKSEWKGALKPTQSMGKVLHKVFSTVVNEISQELTPLGESGSEFPHFILETRNFDEVKNLSKNINKPWLKETLKEIKNLINNQTFLIEDQNEGEPVTPCMDVYKVKIQYDGNLDKLKLRILVRGDWHNKEMVGYTWSPTASMRTLKYFLADAAKHKSRVHQLDFIGAFLQAKVKNRVFVKLGIRYTEYFPECSQYLGRALRLIKSMYGMTNSGKLFFFFFLSFFISLIPVTVTR